MTYTNKYNL
ncbi:uncharacterized protein FRV6_04353 [Fusarium oxysporum]|uniref:Uncharacterized protein n=1 Tax=Fusarium oxysporum TaxID=5507 RepID=A0A2H3TAZ7_FUSOX|nr:uncharacterized protein FRV6_04353 [Fusarium oxysporum]